MNIKLMNKKIKGKPNVLTCPFLRYYVNMLLH